MTASGITFGATTDTVANVANLVMNGGTLYIGSGGTGSVAGATPNSTLYFNGASTIGAVFTDWSTSGIGTANLLATTTFQAADSSAVAHNITYNGLIEGAGGIMKTGGGTLTITNANGYSGLTTVNASRF